MQSLILSGEAASILSTVNPPRGWGMPVSDRKWKERKNKEIRKVNAKTMRTEERMLRETKWINQEIIIREAHIPGNSLRSLLTAA